MELLRPNQADLSRSGYRALIWATRSRPAASSRLTETDSKLNVRCKHLVSTTTLAPRASRRRGICSRAMSTWTPRELSMFGVAEFWCTERGILGRCDRNRRRPSAARRVPTSSDKPEKPDKPKCRQTQAPTKTNWPHRRLATRDPTRLARTWASEHRRASILTRVPTCANIECADAGAASGAR